MSAYHTNELKATATWTTCARLVPITAIKAATGLSTHVPKTADSAFTGFVCEDVVRVLPKMLRDPFAVILLIATIVSGVIDE